MKRFLVFLIISAVSLTVYASTDPIPFKNSVKEAILKAENLRALHTDVLSIVKVYRDTKHVDQETLSKYLREIGHETGVFIEIMTRDRLNFSQRKTIASKTGHLEVLQRLFKMPEIYVKLDPVLKEAKGRWPLLVINGHLVSGSVMNIDADRVMKAEYVSPKTAKKDYGDIAYGGVIAIELSNFTIDELQKYGSILQARKKIKFPRNKRLDAVANYSDCTDLDKDESSLCTKERFDEYIAETMQYPKAAREQGIEGVVNVRFEVTEKGLVNNPIVLNDIGGGCSEEALYLIQNMNYLVRRWNPAKRNKKAVASTVTMPILFSLDGTVIRKPFSAAQDITLQGETKRSLPEVTHDQVLGNELLRYLHEFEIMPRPVFVIDNEIVEKDSVQLSLDKMYHLTLLDEDEAALKYKTVNQRALVISMAAARENEQPGLSKSNWIAYPPSNSDSESDFINDLVIFPNPAKLRINLSFTADPQPLRIQIHDASGKMLYQEFLPEFSGTYDNVIEKKEFVGTHAVISFIQNGKVQTKQLLFAE